MPRTAIAELCEQTGWVLPEQVTTVAVRGTADLGLLGTDRGILADFTDPQPHLLIPGPLPRSPRSAPTVASA